MRELESQPTAASPAPTNQAQAQTQEAQAQAQAALQAEVARRVALERKMQQFAVLVKADKERSAAAVAEGRAALVRRDIELQSARTKAHTQNEVGQRTQSHKTTCVWVPHAYSLSLYFFLFPPPPRTNSFLRPPRNYSKLIEQKAIAALRSLKSQLSAANALLLEKEAKSKSLEQKLVKAFEVLKYWKEESQKAIEEEQEMVKPTVPLPSSYENWRKQRSG